MKAKLKPMFVQPESQGAIEDEEARRGHAERMSRGVEDGRKLKRSYRQYQIGIKTTDEVKKKFDKLRKWTDWTYSDIFDYCIEAGREKIEKERGEKCPDWR